MNNPKELTSTGKRPTQTLGSTWALQRAWSQVASDGKRAQNRARVSALILGVVGAALAASAPQLSPWEDILAVASGVAIAIAAYFGRELLTPNRDSAWMRARIVAEALNRECWLCLMGAPPYVTPKPAKLLQKRVASILQHAGESQAVAGTAPAKIPEVSGLSDYITQRVEDQIAWYERRTSEFARRLRTLKWVLLAIGGGAVAIGVIGSKWGSFLVYVPVCTTLSGTIVSWLQATQAGAVSSVYRETATRLRYEVALWHDRSPMSLMIPAAQNPEGNFVARCEAIMAQENESWRAVLQPEDDDSDARQPPQALHAPRTADGSES